MVIGERFKQLREEKKLSQGDIETSTGLLRCYISRVENGHTVPSVETLEKLARAVGIEMYELFGGKTVPGVRSIDGKRGSVDTKMSKLMARMPQANRKLIVRIAQVLAR
jgi:transcriptional regulator with XRE-family HTH domain